MNIQAYLRPLVKWRRLILVAALLAGLSTLAVTLGQPTVFEAQGTLIIGQSINNPNPSSNQFYLEQELAKIYADMAAREPVRRATMDALGLTSLPLYSVRALPNSQLLEITVTDTSPTRAQAVATELASQLIERSPTGLGSEEQDQESFVNNQLNLLEEDITDTQDEISELEIQLGDLRSAREIADVERQIAALDEKLRTLQASYASLLSSTQRGAVNTLTFIEPPEVPTRPAGPNRFLSVILATMLGATVGAAGAYLIEFLDRRVKDKADVTGLLPWPILSTIGGMDGQTDPATVLIDKPRSVTANSFRLLKTNLDLAGVGTDVRSLLVTGPAASEGKSTVAQNLALAFARSGQKVTLVDGDTHRPKLANRDQPGLSDLLVEGGNVEDVLLRPYLKAAPGFNLLAAGQATLSATGYLDSPAFDKLLSDLKKRSIVIIDGPPSFVSDSLVLATKADAVLPVIRLGNSEKDSVRIMRGQLESARIKVPGVVINGFEEAPGAYLNYYDFNLEEEQEAAGLPAFANRVLQALEASESRKDTRPKQRRGLRSIFRRRVASTNGDEGETVDSNPATVES